MKNVKSVLVLTSLALMLVVVGCSDKSPVAPAENSIGLTGVLESAILPPPEPYRLSARVMTIDQNSRMLTFFGRPDTVIALNDCEIVRLNNGQEIPIPFEDVGPGDSVQCCINRIENNYMYAHRIRVYSEGECQPYEVAFRDTIATIDYQAQTFTVVGRSEEIRVDEYTIIWSQTTSPLRHRNNNNKRNLTGGTSGFSGKASPTTFTTIGTNNLELSFTDLEEGDIVEVKADIIDESTLLAVVIMVAEESYKEKRCVEFTATLASIDCEIRTVTFEEQDYTGVVCESAVLTDAAGEPLALCDFSVGQTVYVKGFVMENGDWKICVMTLQ